MTEQEFIQKLATEGYSEQEIALAKRCYLIGKTSALFEMIEIKMKQLAILR